MEVNSAFNASVCIIGIALFLIHAVNIFLKKGKRRDEISLLVFVLFTAFHFALYLTFTIIKHFVKGNDGLIMTSYTLFYIMNNAELFLFFIYAMSVIPLKKKTKNIFEGINLGLFIVFIILDIINIFVPLFFYSRGGIYERTDFMIFSQGYQFIGFLFVFFLAVTNKKLNASEKIAFILYCILPFVAIFLQNMLKGYAIAYLSIIISIEILFLFVNVKKNMTLADEAKRTKEVEAKLMVSQIQPHFVYNTLSSISTLITIDPNKAQKALDDFTEYLRANIRSVSESGLITFEKELKHIETYLALEKMRFDERLKVSFDIKTTDFLVPPLSIQPLVENAVKHGLMKKLEGGSVLIKTYETSDAFVVEVIDDGVGFVKSQRSTKDNDHIGLSNVEYRLKTMCNGELIVDSVLDKGTTATVKFYK